MIQLSMDTLYQYIGPFVRRWHSPRSDIKTAVSYSRYHSTRNTDTKISREALACYDPLIIDQNIKVVLLASVPLFTRHPEALKPSLNGVPRSRTLCVSMSAEKRIYRQSPVLCSDSPCFRISGKE